MPKLNFSKIYASKAPYIYKYIHSKSTILFKHFMCTFYDEYLKHISSITFLYSAIL